MFQRDAAAFPDLNNELPILLLQIEMMANNMKKIWRGNKPQLSVKLTDSGLNGMIASILLRNIIFNDDSLFFVPEVVQASAAVEFNLQWLLQDTRSN